MIQWIARLICRLIGHRWRLDASYYPASSKEVSFWYQCRICKRWGLSLGELHYLDTTREEMNCG